MASFRETMFTLLFFFTLSAINSVMTAPVGLCSKPMDIAFIVDKSGSIGRKQLGYIKSFMEKTVDYFAMSDQENHYAIIEFGKSPRIIVNFNTFTEDEDEKRSANLKLKIKQMNRIDWGGGSFIDRALLAANSQLFTVGAGMRQNGTKMAFVITDGIQTKNRGYFLPLHTAAEGLLKKGVQLFVVAIGGDIDISELGDIAADKNIFNIHRYLGHLDRIASKVCSTLTAVPTTSTSLK